ncbi:SIR2 family protein [Serratia liquefaciens]|uniref:anti-phage defense-associated sirtuin Dsr1 n=1 Tax=Serratia liquefaciens TaxID=614 RepID=UPI0018D64E4A|nr:anti-phage defense-associated sirtuin Dsr1 [Serratia liquefaciens]MBH2809039.1 SIR2 family protein [Serratia liquefaciens]HEJ7948570.1 SIR2 family protein [Serratia liquefaciens]
MQFITNGPDIPESLLQAHEEGRVVFFCGAGISYPARLPGFEGLVKEIYRLNGTKPSELEQAVLDRGQYDATLDLLERRLPGQRLAVRRALVSALKPNTRIKGAVDTQAALLRLARNREGSLKLVTTNFDRIFHVAAKRTRQTFHEYSSPMLPIPKNSRWDGLVFLHGLIPDKPDDTVLNRLVVTSGDFGLAYLTERWAARFVSELFRNYVVCFVGYSINDPVLRYMMDALAADRMLGEITPQAWALGDCEPGQEEQKANEWEAKGVTPVLYNVKAGSRDHSALHKTLHAWADTYRDGVQGKEAIVVKHAPARPQDTTRQDNFVGRMLWALSDKSGLPAKRFADFDPVPSLDWLLETFSLETLGHEDLARFGVPPQEEVDTKLRFSLVRRPASYTRAPYMCLASRGLTDSQWDDVMTHISRWLIRHLDDPRLIIWIAERGGQLHERCMWLIQQKLDYLATLKLNGKVAELDEIRLNAPKAVPGPHMCTLWNLLLSERLKSVGYNSDLYSWFSRLKRDGLTTTMRLKLRELLSPKILLRKPIRWDYGVSDTDEPLSIRHLVDWELVLAADHVYSTLDEEANGNWNTALPILLNDFQQLLRDALDLLHELGEADEFRDRSYWDLPSIIPHWQNRGFHDWVSLITLLRDSWLAVRANDIPRAAIIAQGWIELPYPTFKRLALFAASHDNCISSEEWVKWLLSDDSWWLWCVETKREVNRLFVLQGRHLNGLAQENLETAILAGPPRRMYRDNLEDGRWQSITDHSVWLHLAKLKTSDLDLGEAATARLAELSNKYPAWKLADNERDEFSHWMSGTGDPDYEDSQDIEPAPRNRQELVIWLQKPEPEHRPIYEDTWRDVCRTRFFHSAYALCELAKSDIWPPDRWRVALQVWADDGLVLRSWHYVAPVVQTMPDHFLKEIIHSVAWWMETASKVINHHKDILIGLCRRILALPLEAGTDANIVSNGIKSYSPVDAAINHPIGHVTQILVNLWFKQDPNDNEQLPDYLKSIFSALCDPDIEQFIHGRVLLSSQLIALFRVDRSWTEQYLLPFFNWDNPFEAKSVWEGFLWSPRLYQPLMTAFKSQCLDSANHYAELGDHRQQYATFLTYAALGPTADYTTEEFRTAFNALPSEGLEKCALALSQAQEGAADKREDYWKNRVRPLWQNIWPKSRDLVTSQMTVSLARLIIATGDEFPSALDDVHNWLIPVEHPYYVIHRLLESGLCTRFPVEAALLLGYIIAGEKRQWLSEELGTCLDNIIQAAPNLEQDVQYSRLREYYRRNSA